MLTIFFLFDIIVVHSQNLLFAYEALCSQGSFRSLKSWKVLEFPGLVFFFSCRIGTGVQKIELATMLIRARFYGPLVVILINTTINFLYSIKLIKLFCFILKVILLLLRLAWVEAMQVTIQCLQAMVRQHPWLEQDMVMVSPVCIPLHCTSYCTITPLLTSSIVIGWEH